MTEKPLLGVERLESPARRHFALEQHFRTNCDICVAADTLPADETPSGDIETEIVLQSDRVPAEVCTAVGRAGLAIGNAGRKGLDHIVVVIR